MKRMHVYLNFPGNTEEAFEFYKSALGGEFDSVMRFSDVPDMSKDMEETDKKKIMHISLPVGQDTILMGTDTLESLGQKTTMGNNIYIYLDADSKEEADRMFGALSQGGKVEMPMKEEFWGDYFGSFTDKFGVQWMVSCSGKKEE